MPKPSLLQEEKKWKKESLFISTVTELGERKRHAGLHSNSKITTTVSNKSLCVKPVLSAHTHTHIYISWRQLFHMRHPTSCRKWFSLTVAFCTGSTGPLGASRCDNVNPTYTSAWPTTQLEPGQSTTSTITSTHRPKMDNTGCSVGTPCFSQLQCWLKWSRSLKSCDLTDALFCCHVCSSVSLLLVPVAMVLGRLWRWVRRELHSSWQSVSMMCVRAFSSDRKLWARSCSSSALSKPNPAVRQSDKKLWARSYISSIL